MHTGAGTVEVSETGENIERLCRTIGRVIYGKDEVIRLVVVCLLAKGHILIEDVPGIGKTTLANTLARSVNCSFQRIQFTSDLLPTDILGVSIYNSREERFEFQRGPIFANVVLADEVNRASPKTQSALLEAMNERQVSYDSNTYPLPRPFIVIATQNPVEHYGTFPLPESQLDRFMMKIGIGYPSTAQEIEMILSRKEGDPLNEVKPALDATDVLALQEQVETIRVDSSLMDYLMRIVEATRTSDLVDLGVSPRGGLSLFRLAQARALVNGRDYVVPDDIKLLAVNAFAHRLVLSSDYGPRAAGASSAEQVIKNILSEIPVPL
ncbi:MAG: MoxR family ATPase [Verrucomicrobia bacterium]|nr:MoxR family ATPase [Verrucomicrobiota bacterium]